MLKPRKRIQPLQTQIDLSYLNAATILARQPKNDPITIILVGCGGTGSYMAQNIGHLLQGLSEKGVAAKAVFIDPDYVEPANIGRQLFSNAELGFSKAQTLAFRYTGAWAPEITAICARFTASMSRPSKGNGLYILVGCVDNPAGRQELAKALERNRPGHPPDVWWLDCGNHAETGQILLGTAITREQLKNAFPAKRICQALPAPSIQHPELLTIKKIKTPKRKLSCAELAEANLQSRDINKRIAAEASDFLTRLLLTRNLKRFGCEINLPAGVMTSTYATPEVIALF